MSASARAASANKLYHCRTQDSRSQSVTSVRKPSRWQACVHGTAISGAGAETGLSLRSHRTTSIPRASPLLVRGEGVSERSGRRVRFTGGWRIERQQLDRAVNLIRPLRGHLLLNQEKGRAYRHRTEPAKRQPSEAPAWKGTISVPPTLMRPGTD